MFGLPIKGCYIYDEDGARKPNQLKIKVMSLENFKNFTHPDKILPMLEKNNKVWSLLENCVSSNREMLKLFDEFNDNKASKRIINYILEHGK